MGTRCAQPGLGALAALIAEPKRPCRLLIFSGKLNTGCGATRPEAADFGRTSPVAQISRLKASAISGKLSLPGMSFPASPGVQGPPLRRAFAIAGSGGRPRVNDIAHAPDCAHIAS